MTDFHFLNHELCLLSDVLKGQIREKKLLMETTKNKREEEEFKGLNVGLEAGYKETQMLSRGVGEGCEGVEIFAISEQGLRGEIKVTSDLRGFQISVMSGGVAPPIILLPSWLNQR